MLIAILSHYNCIKLHMPGDKSDCEVDEENILLNRSTQIMPEAHAHQAVVSCCIVVIIN